MSPSHHEKIATRLGIGYERIALYRDPSQQKWRCARSHNWLRVEDAALAHFQAEGWSGYAGEGGLILNLIKAMSFPRLGIRHRATFVEALYAQNVAFAEDHFETATLLGNVRRASKRQIVKNFRVMADGRSHTEKHGNIASSTNTCMHDHFPDLKIEHFLGLYSVLGTENICEIAKIFATDPYRYRKGWPDLTLWRKNRVAFKEIKAPGDKLHSSQRELITAILEPLGFATSIVDIKAMDAEELNFEVSPDRRRWPFASRNTRQ